MKRNLIVIGIVVAALFLSSAMGALAGGTWYVNAAKGNDNNDCLTRQTACKTISHAISLAASGDTIKVAAGTYVENLTIDKSLTINGVSESTTIIDGGQVNTVITIPNTSSSVRLSHVTIQNGITDGYGGGIYNTGTLTVNTSIFSGNSTGGRVGGGGGGIFSAGTLIVNNSTFSGNHVGAVGANGGGILNEGVATITNSTFRGNSLGSPGDGAGIFNTGTLTVSNSTFAENSAISGGAGGGISSSGMLKVSNSTLAGNSAYLGGGLVTDGTATITNSTISGNSSNIQSGGGIGNYGTLTITNSTLSGNSANGSGVSGGGIFNEGTLRINNSTLSENSAPGNGASGGGIFNEGVATLENTIVANSPSGGNCAGIITSNGYNLSSDGSCAFSNIGDLNNTDPMLGPLQNNGGPTLTHALLAGSPAINAGNPGSNNGKGTHCMPTDQRGVLRTDRCDMGAYEYP